MDSESFTIVVTQVLNGLTTISIFALIALGLAVIYGMMGILNLAHGELFMIGAFSVWFTLHQGGPFWLGLVMAPLVAASVGALLERGILRFLRERVLDTLLATWGISVFLREGVRAIFGNDTKTIISPLEGSIHIGSLTYPVYYLFVILMTGVVIVCVFLFFRSTEIGIKARAVLQNQDAAAVLAIHIGKMRTISFALGAALAGLAGAIMSPLIGVYPSMGLKFVVQSFLAIILGGVGGIGGALVGSGVIGGLQSFLTFIMAPVIGTTITLGLVIIILCFRPNGIFRQ